MPKDFSKQTYVVDDVLADTLTWLCHHQDIFDAFEYDALTQILKVHHANGTDPRRYVSECQIRYFNYFVITLCCNQNV